jgi:hypothetical protein
MISHKKAHKPQNDLLSERRPIKKILLGLMCLFVANLQKAETTAKLIAATKHQRRVYNGVHQK